jgi:hypothetical protein
VTDGSIIKEYSNETQCQDSENLKIIKKFMVINTDKGKAVPLHAWSGPEGPGSYGSQIS